MEMAGRTRTRSRVPDIIGHYAVESSEHLGQGTYGIVYLGWDRNSDGQVAVKRIKIPITVHSTDLMKRIDNELSSLVSVNHPNIVRLLYNENIEECVYMILELCTCNLQEFACGHELSEQLKMTFIHDLFQAVRYLHKKGIIHRDIKPENVLVKDNNGTHTVKITDFGLSRRVPEDSSISRFTATADIGSPYWMAPEIFSGPDFSTPTRYSLLADVFSAGLLAGSISKHTPQESLKPETGMQSTLDLI